MTRPFIALLLLLAFVAAGKAQTISPAGSGSGGSGTVTSISAGCGSSTGGSAITTTGTIAAVEPVDGAGTGTNYAIPNTDCGFLVNLNNGSAQTPTIAQAGAGGSFTAGWFADVCNVGAGVQTLTPATSTIAGAASQILHIGDCIRVVSDGTNYQLANTGLLTLATGSVTNPSIIFGASVAGGNTTGFHYNAAGRNVIIDSQGSAGLALGYQVVRTGSGGIVGWSSSQFNPDTTGFDTAFTRDSAGVIDVGTGAAASKAGSMNMTNLAATGTVNFAGLSNTATTSAVCFNTGTGAITYDGTIGTCTTSDERLKNIGPRIDDALTKLLAINGFYFTYKDDKYGRGKQIGVGAQTVEKVFPELVETGSDGIKSVAYEKLVAPIIEALRELKTDNDQMRACLGSWHCRLFGM